MLPEIQQFFNPPKDILWQAVWPTLIVILTGIVALILEIIRPKKTNGAIVVASIIGLGVALGAVFQQLGSAPAETLVGMVTMDRFGQVLQALLIVSCAVVLLFSEGYLKGKRIPFGEFYPLILWSTAGAMMMVSTKNLLMIFLGLEILSIALYVLAGLSRNEARSEESAMKYFLLGAFATGFLLYGMALIYGATGSLHLDAIASAWPQTEGVTRPLLVMGLAFGLVGFCFKSAFVPFHQWTPDVYQGAPTNVTAFMAAGSKIAAIGALVRFLDASSSMIDIWMPALFWIAILTMTVGNLVALVQKDVKRILGYSSIAHAGYLLVAILAHAKSPDTIGYQSLAFYLLSYAFMTLGAFATVTIVASHGKDHTLVKDLNGLWKRNPMAALALLLFMVSLIGMPPTAGFVGKFLIFRDAMSAGLMPLAIVLAVNSVISIYYYLGIAKAVFVSEVEEDQSAPLKLNPGLGAAVAVCAAGVLAATIFFDSIQNRFIGTHDVVEYKLQAQVPASNAVAER